MKTTLRQPALCAIIFTLVACGQTTSAPAPVAEPAPAGAAASAAATVLTPAMLVGSWGDNGDCTKDIVFNADGSFQSYTGGAGRWTLSGDRMTMSGTGGTFEVGVQLLNADQLMILNPDGSYGISQRC
jgi:hypothetical protein